MVKLSAKESRKEMRSWRKTFMLREQNHWGVKKHSVVLNDFASTLTIFADYFDHFGDYFDHFGDYFDHFASYFDAWNECVSSFGSFRIGFGCIPMRRMCNAAHKCVGCWNAAKSHLFHRKTQFSLNFRASQGPSEALACRREWMYFDFSCVAVLGEVFFWW